MCAHRSLLLYRDVFVHVTKFNLYVFTGRELILWL